jgi:thiol:disulfide interchange protein DsbC|tara:strand:- start:932 stop:1633 length:702 start_codon:yes stop_codon:yes gene_type:complete
MKKVLISLFFCSSLFSQDLLLVKEKINKILPEGVSVKEITYSKERDIFIVDIGDIQPIYVLPNTEYIILGDIFSLKGERPESETEKDKGRFRLKILSEIDQDSFIRFKSNNEKSVLTVFTDVECTYCRKFHSEINEYLENGISINYLAFPRTGIDSSSYEKMVAAWCSSEKKESITNLKNDIDIGMYECENPVESHFEIGRRIGVTGTPAIITQSGLLLPGYIPAKELIGIIN